MLIEIGCAVVAFIAGVNLANRGTENNLNVLRRQWQERFDFSEKELQRAKVEILYRERDLAYTRLMDSFHSESSKRFALNIVMSCYDGMEAIKYLENVESIYSGESFGMREVIENLKHDIEMHEEAQQDLERAYHELGETLYFHDSIKERTPKTVRAHFEKAIKNINEYFKENEKSAHESIRVYGK